jgi:cell division control protein 6
VFASKDVLRDDYRPDELLERDEEKEEFVHALAPIVNGEQPNNVFLYGKTGVGKTLATRLIIDELLADTADIAPVDVRTVWVNCKDKTSYNTAVAVVNQLRDSENQIPEQGHSESAVHNML